MSIASILSGTRSADSIELADAIARLVASRPNDAGALGSEKSVEARGVSPLPGSFEADIVGTEATGGPAPGRGLDSWA